MYQIETVINQIICGNNIEVMKEIPENSIDMVLTSPPYDNLRVYDGFEFNFEDTAKELFRILKDGGTIVWVVGDATIDGSETGTSFKQALYFKDLGFKLHDTMIYYKNFFQVSSGNPTRYHNNFEYIFVLVKGKIKTFNGIKDRKNVVTGQMKVGQVRQKDGTIKNRPGNYVLEYGLRNNIWRYEVGGGKTTMDKVDHPAMFPEKLAQDHIISWSNKGDLILDPFNGSGTTTKIAKQLGRNYIGIDIAEKYCEMAKSRLRQDVLPI